MIALSIDTETSARKPENGVVLEFAAVLFDLKRDQPVENLCGFHAYLRHEVITGEPEALAMHGELLKKIASPQERYMDGNVDTLWCRPDRLFEKFMSWATTSVPGRTPFNVVGKNFGAFDLPFLRRIEGFEDRLFHYRSLDPALLFFNSSDLVLPNSQQCMERAGMEGVVAHGALEDARMVIEQTRRGLRNLRTYDDSFSGR